MTTISPFFRLFFLTFSYSLLFFYALLSTLHTLYTINFSYIQYTAHATRRTHGAPRRSDCPQ